MDQGRCDGIVPEARRIVELWDDTLTKLEARDLDALSTRLDWALKLSMLERARARRPDLAWNAPDVHFKKDTWDKIVQATLECIWTHTRDDDGCARWTEVDGIKTLFHPTQPWARGPVHAFVDAAWRYVGVRR